MKPGSRGDAKPGGILIKPPVGIGYGDPIGDPKPEDKPPVGDGQPLPVGDGTPIDDPRDPNVRAGANLWGVETLFGRRGMHRVYGQPVSVAGRGDTGEGIPLPQEPHTPPETGGPSPDPRPAPRPIYNPPGGGGHPGASGRPSPGHPADPVAPDPTVVGSQAWMQSQLDSDLLSWDFAMGGIFGGTPPTDVSEAHAMIDQVIGNLRDDIDTWYSAGNFDQATRNAAIVRLHEQEDAWKAAYWDWHQQQPDPSGPTNTGSAGGADPDPTIDPINTAGGGVGTGFLRDVLAPFEDVVFDQLGLNFDAVASGQLEPGQLKWLMGQYAQNNALTNAEWWAYRQVFNAIYGEEQGYFASIASIPISQWELPNSGSSGTDPNIPHPVYDEDGGL